MSVTREDIETIMATVDCYSNLDHCWGDVYVALCDLYDIDPEGDEEDDLYG